MGKSLISTISGGVQAGVYQALTSGWAGKAGTTAFGAAWTGGAVPVSSGALAAGGELGWGASNMAALGSGTGMGGIAGKLAVAVPWIAAAAAVFAAAMQVMKYQQKKDPSMWLYSGQANPGATHMYDGAMSIRNPGELNLSQYGLAIEFQDVSKEPQAQIGKAFHDYVNSYFEAVDDAIDISLGEALSAAEIKTREAKFGDYEDDLGQMFNDLVSDVFTQARETLIDAMFKGADEITYEKTGFHVTGQKTHNITGGFREGESYTEDIVQFISQEVTESVAQALFNDEFFAAIQQEGETLWDTFVRFEDVMTGSDMSLERFNEQMETTGKSAVEVYEGFEALNVIMKAVEDQQKALATNTKTQGLLTLITDLKVALSAMSSGGATEAEIERVTTAGNEVIGASVTGINADSLSDALWNAINNNQSADEFVSSLEEQIRQGAALALLNAFSEPLYQAIFTPINDIMGQAISSMVTEIITGGVVTAATLEAGVEGITAALGTALLILESPAVQEAFSLVMEGVEKILGPRQNSNNVTPALPNYQASNQQNQTSSQSEFDFSGWQDEMSGFNKMESRMERFGITFDDVSNIVNWATTTTYPEFMAVANVLNLTVEEATSFIEEMDEAAKQMAEAFKENLKTLDDYILAYTPMNDVLKSTKVSIKNAIDNYTTMIETAEKAGRSGELLTAAINEALTPFVDGVMDAFNGLRESTLSDLEQNIESTALSFYHLREAGYALYEAGVLDLVNDGIGDFAGNINLLIDTLEEANNLQIYRDLILSLGDAQAQIAGLTDEFELIKLSAKYGTDLTNPQIQMAAISGFANMDYDGLKAMSESTGVAMDVIIADMLTLAGIAMKTADAFEDVADSLKKYSKSLLLDTTATPMISPDLRKTIAKAEFDETMLRAMSADPKIAEEALKELPGLADNYLKASRDSTTNMLAYNQDVGFILASLDKAEKYARSYTSDIEDMDSLQKKTLPSLIDIAAESQAISDQIETIFDDPTLQGFFSTFTSVFGNDPIMSLSGNIDSFADIIENWRNDPVWSGLRDFLLSGTMISGSGSISTGNTPFSQFSQYSSVSSALSRLGVTNASDIQMVQWADEWQGMNINQQQSLSQAAYGSNPTHYGSINMAYAEINSVAQWIKQMQSQSLGGYASGGFPSAGEFAMVGEQGPELVRFNVPSQVYSNPDTMSMFARDNSDVVKELQDLKSENKRMVASLKDMQINLDKQRKIISKWDVDGIPEEREAA
ncbi:MAG: hypothetical protein HQK65_04570 [Desulfamplus sp.]|nr:hypothetical protein [Desulfamplus sp.]